MKMGLEKLVRNWKIKALTLGCLGLSGLIFEGCTSTLRKDIVPGEQKIKIMRKEDKVFSKTTYSFEYAGKKYEVGAWKNNLVFFDEEGVRRDIFVMNYEIKLLMRQEAFPSSIIPGYMQGINRFYFEREISCGAQALYKAFRNLGHYTPFDIEEINLKRKGGFEKKFAGFFYGQAKLSTSTKEMMNIAKDYGFKVDYYDDEKDKLLEIMEREYGKGKQVIAGISMDPEHTLTTRHWTVYEKGYYYDLILPAEYYPLYEILVLSK